MNNDSPSQTIQPPTQNPGPDSGNTLTKHRPAQRDTRRGAIRCRFYTSKKGCRAGDSCPYLHDAANDLLSPEGSSTVQLSQASELRDSGVSESSNGPISLPRHVADPGRKEAARYVAPSVSASIHPKPQVRTATAKPVSQQQKSNPRDFELQQLRRRFGPGETATDNATILTFDLVPTDPDFPFELDGLHCALHVPTSYPAAGKPSLRVHNAEMERGFQINVEKGFDDLVGKHPGKSLLALMNALDRDLEAFLTSRKTQTIKLIPNSQVVKPTKTVRGEIEQQPRTEAVPNQSEVFSPGQRREAAERRAAEVRQLEARLGRQSLFSKSDNGTDFVVPVQVPKAGRLPFELQSIKQVSLFVPLLYNLEPCTIRMKGFAGPTARDVEKGFMEYSQTHNDISLMAKLNHLSQNMHIMASRPTGGCTSFEQPTLLAPEPRAQEQQTSPVQSSSIYGQSIDQEKPHVQLIPRPPEWDMSDDGSSEDDDEEGSSRDYSTDEDNSAEQDVTDEEGGAQVPKAEQASTSSTVEKGILLTFPDLELHGVELLELASISLTVKCTRCKDPVDVHNIQPSSSTSTTTTTTTCSKCRSDISISYHPQPLHAHSVRAGHLVDVVGGAFSIFDLLPSRFIPTCSSCSTTYTATSVQAVRGDTATSTTTRCRECHQHLSFAIPQVKFLRVSSHHQNQPLPLRRRPHKDTQGLVSGTPLPENGRCKHYSKSYRWFRFSCCPAKTYPCDKCHDAAESHPNEHANRMVCGWCSREQIYRPEDCAVCKRSVVKKSTGGRFWEGGKGTRDKVRMSRKDPRKFKRRNK